MKNIHLFLIYFISLLSISEVFAFPQRSGTQTSPATASTPCYSSRSAHCSARGGIMKNGSCFKDGSGFLRVQTCNRTPTNSTCSNGQCSCNPYYSASNDSATGYTCSLNYSGLFGLGGVLGLTAAGGSACITTLNPLACSLGLTSGVSIGIILGDLMNGDDGSTLVTKETPNSEDLHITITDSSQSTKTNSSGEKIPEIDWNEDQITSSADQQTNYTRNEWGEITGMTSTKSPSSGGGGGGGSVSGGGSLSASGGSTGGSQKYLDQPFGLNPFNETVHVEQDGDGTISLVNVVPSPDGDGVDIYTGVIEENGNNQEIFNGILYDCNLSCVDNWNEQLGGGYNSTTLMTDGQSCNGVTAISNDGRWCIHTSVGEGVTDQPNNGMGSTFVTTSQDCANKGGTVLSQMRTNVAGGSATRVICNTPPANTPSNSGGGSGNDGNNGTDTGNGEDTGTGTGTGGETGEGVGNSPTTGTGSGGSGDNTDAGTGTGSGTGSGAGGSGGGTGNGNGETGTGSGTGSGTGTGTGTGSGSGSGQTNGTGSGTGGGGDCAVYGCAKEVTLLSIKDILNNSNGEGINESVNSAETGIKDAIQSARDSANANLDSAIQSMGLDTLYGQYEQLNPLSKFNGTNCSINTNLFGIELNLSYCQEQADIHRIIAFILFTLFVLSVKDLLFERVQ